MDRRWICGVAVGFLCALAGEVAAGQPAPGAPAAQPAKQDGRPFALMVGDQAPDLDVAWYQPQGPSRKVEKGRTYHMKIERKGDTISAWGDGQLLVRFVDADPLWGPGHDHFAINNWQSELWFDNLKITPL